MTRLMKRLVFVLIGLLAAGPARAVVTVNSDGVILVDGAPFFPVGGYLVSWSLTTSAIISDLQQMKSDGFLSAHVSLNKTNAEHLQILDTAQSLGMKIIAEGDISRVTAIKNHPALLAWTIIDEPEYNNESPAYVQSLQAQYKAVDTTHPTIACISNPNAYASYAAIPDILATDLYPDAGENPPQTPAYVGDSTLIAFSYRKQLIVVVQAFSAIENGGSTQFLLPSPESERSMTYQAVVGGARGINFFAFHSPPSGGGWYLPNSPALYNAVKTLVGELKTLGPILATATARNAMTPPATGIMAASVQSGGKSYILAVNQLNQATPNVQFTVDSNVASANVLFENRSVTPSGGVLSDSFAAYASHVYKLVPTPLSNTGFTVQNGMAERSFVRYLTLAFATATGVQDLITYNRIQLTKYPLNWNGTDAGVPVSLTGLVTANGAEIDIDFGALGLGGSPNTTAGDGYYDLALDLDADGTFETHRHFYRLLGDVDGDGVVTTSDANLILAAFGQTGQNINEDVNGNGAVNAADRTYTLRCLGHQLAAGLPIDN